MSKIVILGTDNFAGLKYVSNICRMVNEELGDNRNADIVFKGIDYYKIREAEKKGDFEESKSIIIEKMLDFSNSIDDCKFVFPHQGMHRYVKAIENKFEDMGVPTHFIHSATSISREIRKRGIERNIASSVMLIGTKPVMNEKFMVNELVEEKLFPLTPNTDEQEIIHEVITKDLINGNIGDRQRDTIKRIVTKIDESCKNAGKYEIDALVLGCGELGKVIKNGDIRLPVIDCVEAQINHVSDIIINNYVKNELEDVYFPRLNEDDMKGFSLATLRMICGRNLSENSNPVDNVQYFAMNELCNNRNQLIARPKRKIKEL